MKLTGNTNHIVFPRIYFVPDNEEKMFEDKYNWCYSIDENNNPIMFRMNMNIEKIAFEKDTHKPKPVIGENNRVKGERSGKVMPAIWNFADEGEANFFCAAYEDNSMDFERKGGVILLSKAIEVDEHIMSECKKDFFENFGENMPEAKYYECGYARVLNQGIPKEISKKKKILMEKTIERPIFGSGRLEMTVRKPSEKSLMYALSNQIPRFKGKHHNAKQHMDNFRSLVKEHQKIKQKCAENPSEENLRERQQSLDTLNQFEGVELMRTHMKGNLSYAKWGELQANIRSLDEIVRAYPNDEVKKTELSNLREQADEIAVKSEIADFKIKIFHPESIQKVNFDPNEISQKLQEIYDNFTYGGSYGGAYLRVMDNKGRTIPKLFLNFQCKFLGINRVSNAKDDLNYMMKTDIWNSISTYINQGLQFDLLPFSMTKTPGPGKNSYIAISKMWLGDVSKGLSPGRNLYVDPITGEFKNTYIAASRRRSKDQQGSAFIANVFATGYDGEAASEYTMGLSGNADLQIRSRK